MAADRLTSAAHFLIARVPPHKLGAVKLNKMLWFADCQFYGKSGRTITGETKYIRKGNGPCVDGFDAMIGQLKSSGAIIEHSAQALDFKRREFYAQKEPDLSVFTPEEVDTLWNVAAQIMGMTAAEASDLSHDDLWEETPAYGAISVAAGAVKVEPIDAADLSWARSAFA